MMHCACRTAALKLFIRNVATVNVSESFAARAAAAAAARVGQSSRPVSGTTLSHSRLNLGYSGFHTSRICHAESRKDGATLERRGSVQDAAHTRDSGVVKAAPPGADGTTGTRVRRVEGEWKGKKSINRPAEGSGPHPKPDYKPRSSARPGTRPPQHDDDLGPRPKKEDWQIQKKALQEKFPDGWNPRKKLSPDALDGIRALHEQYPDVYTTEVLAERFEVSAEAIRRILKSRWRAKPAEEEDRQERWFNRGKKVWARWAELGKKPPRKWRQEGVVRDPKWHAPRRPPPEQRPQFRDEDAGGGGGGRTESAGKRMRAAGRPLTAQQKLARSLV